MKKALTMFGLTALLATQLFAASYWVVLKNGARYEAKGKPTVTAGKATITLTNGQVIQVDASAIDNAKSEEMTRLGGATDLTVEHQPVAAPKQKASLGSQIRIRRQQAEQDAANTPPRPPPTAAPAAGPKLSAEVLEKFERAYENVGIFEHKLTSSGPRGLRADLTADSEEKVFNALSATAYLMIHNAGLAGVQIDEADIFMKMTNGGAAGRFHMTRADAAALYANVPSPDRHRLEDYYVRKVLF